MCYSIEIIREDVDFYINIPDLSLWNTQFKNAIYFKHLLELWNQFLVTDLFQTPDKCDSEGCNTHFQKKNVDQIVDSFIIFMLS